MKVREYEILNDAVIVIYDRIFPLYIIRGDKNYLVDSGTTLKAPEAAENIDRVLRETGSKEGIQTLLLTHTHWDHTGGAYYLQQKYGFNVIGSQRAAQLLPKSKVIGFIDRLNQEYKKMNGVDSDTAFGLLENVIAVFEGDRIRIDDRYYLEVFETPGHTKCSVSYLMHPGKLLFLGDSSGVLEQDNSIKPLFLSSYSEYINSIEKLMALDAEILAFPHNRRIKGAENVKNHFERAKNRAIEVKDMILKKMETEEDITRIAEAILDGEFGKPTLFGPREAMLINFEAMVKAVQKDCI